MVYLHPHSAGSDRRTHRALPGHSLGISAYDGLDSR